MDRYIHSDIYPDFHIEFVKSKSVNDVSAVSLKDLGFPEDVDYRDQSLEELSNERQASLINEFVFLIEKVLPRNIQDLFYKIALDPRPVYWKLFDKAADLMQLERYTDHSKNNYGQFVNHVQMGIMDMVEAGMTLAEIYVSTCVTKTMLQSVAYGGFPKDYESKNNRRWLNMPIEAQLLKLKDITYKVFVTLEGFEFDFMVYKEELPVLGVTYVPYDYYTAKYDEDADDLRDRVSKQLRMCYEKQIPFLIIDPDETDDFEDSSYAYKLFQNAIGNFSYAYEHNEKRAKQWMLSDIDFTDDIRSFDEVEEYYYPEGQISKIKLVSNCLSFGPMPEADAEIEQHLTLFTDGRVYFYGYNFGDYNGMSPSKRTRSKQFRIDAIKAGYLVSNIAMYFASNNEPIFATDVGTWELEITNIDNKVFKYSGSLFMDLIFNGVKISSAMRKYIGIPELFCFDGCGRTPIEKADDEYIFVNVSFGNGSKTYCYLCDDCNVMEGDEVLVPVGNDGDTKVVTVESIDIVTAENAPFPVDKCKKVLKIVEGE